MASVEKKRTKKEWIFLIFLNIVTVILLTRSCVGWILDEDLLSYPRPYIGGAFTDTDTCKEEMQALIIALHAYPYVYRDADFGLNEAATTLEANDCHDLFKKKQFNPKLIAKLKAFNKTMRQSAKQGEPSYFLYGSKKNGHGETNIRYYNPEFMIGQLVSLYKAYHKVYSGKGFTHFLRCDYTLYNEPYHTFILSNIVYGSGIPYGANKRYGANLLYHSNTPYPAKTRLGYLNEDIKARIIECGAMRTLQAEIDTLLSSELGKMTIVVQE